MQSITPPATAQNLAQEEDGWGPSLIPPMTNAPVQQPEDAWGELLQSAQVITVPESPVTKNVAPKRLAVTQRMLLNIEWRHLETGHVPLWARTTLVRSVTRAFFGSLGPHVSTAICEDELGADDRCVLECTLPCAEVRRLHELDSHGLGIQKTIDLDDDVRELLDQYHLHLHVETKSNNTRFHITIAAYDPNF
jgi:hypothetical protein